MVDPDNEVGTVHIVTAEPEEADVLAGLVAEAFADLELTHWLVPDPSARRRVLAANFRTIVEHALSYGTVQATSDRTAVAVWLPATPVPDIAGYDARLASACGEYTDRFRALDEAMHAAHPTTPPHEHLAFLAVTPLRQGEGLGSALLRHRHQALNAAGIPAYLEASSLRSRALYLRHGYRPHGGLFRPAPDAAPMWPMWRNPPR